MVKGKKEDKDKEIDRRKERKTNVRTEERDDEGILEKEGQNWEACVLYVVLNSRAKRGQLFLSDL